MSRRRIVLIDRGATFVVRGWRGGELAREAGMWPVFNRVAQGWVLDTKVLPDFVAYLEYRNIAVMVRADG